MKTETIWDNENENKIKEKIINKILRKRFKTKEISLAMSMLLSSYHHLVWLALIGRNSNFIFLHSEQVNYEIETYPHQENGRGSQDNFLIFL